MSKLKFNGDYLTNQLLTMSKVFEGFMNKNDTKNMFVILKEIRIIHGMMIVKQDQMIKNVKKTDDYHELSIFSNILSKTEKLINDYEDKSFNLLKKNKIDNSDEIILIDQNDISNLDNDEQNYIIYFTDSNCEHCLNFDKTWNQFEENSKEYKLDFIKIDCNNYFEKCQDFNINEYPSIRLYTKNKELKFSEPRTLDNLLNFIKNIPLN